MISLVSLLNLSILISSSSVPTSILDKYVLIMPIGSSEEDFMADIIVFLDASRSSSLIFPSLIFFKHFFINLIHLSIFSLSTPELMIRILSYAFTEEFM